MAALANALGKQQAFELHNFNRLKTGRKKKLQMERRTTVHDTSLPLPFFSLLLSLWALHTLNV